MVQGLSFFPWQGALLAHRQRFQDEANSSYALVDRTNGWINGNSRHCDSDHEGASAGLLIPVHNYGQFCVSEEHQDLLMRSVSLLNLWRWESNQR